MKALGLLFVRTPAKRFIWRKTNGQSGVGRHRHEAFGLQIDSELELPGVMPGDGSRPPDITIGYDTLPVSDPDTKDITAVAAGGNDVLLGDEHGRYRVRDGRQIVVQTLPDADEQRVRDYLLGPVLAMLLMQRGFLVLHGSAVQINGTAIAILGPSGLGKSTTASALMSRGHPLLSDDIVAIDLRNDGEQPVVLAGFPTFNLWPDAEQSLQTDAYAQLLVRSRSSKGSFVAAHFDSGHVQLSRVFFLERDHVPGIRTPLAVEAVTVLFNHSFGPELMAFGASDPILQQCARLIRRVKARFLARTESYEDLPLLLELIDAEVQDGKSTMVPFDASRNVSGQ